MLVLSCTLVLAGIASVAWGFLNSGIGQMGAVAAESSRTFERWLTIGVVLLLIADCTFLLSFLRKGT